jgi:hypothetical protein
MGGAYTRVRVEAPVYEFPPHPRKNRKGAEKQIKDYIRWRWDFMSGYRLNTYAQRVILEEVFGVSAARRELDMDETYQWLAASLRVHNGEAQQRVQNALNELVATADQYATRYQLQPGSTLPDEIVWYTFPEAAERVSYRKATGGYPKQRNGKSPRG